MGEGVDRRELWRMLAAASALAGLSGTRALAQVAEADAYLRSLAAEAANVFALRDIAETKVRRGPWSWMSTGADAETTLRANTEIFGRLQIKTRRLIDVRSIDLGIDLFGQRYASPIGLAPIGFQRVFHPDHEPGTAAAAEVHGGPMIAGMLSSARYRDIAAPLTRKPWLQLYDRWERGVIRDVLDQVAAAGCPVVALTVDTPIGGNREVANRFNAEMVFEGPMAAGNMPAGVDPLLPPNAGLTWEFVEWLKANTRMKVLLKGIVAAEDARLARDAGVDGLIVSNHGGRQEESGRSALESLVEVRQAIGGDLPVMVDGGIRRGTDAFKALALGADAVFVGRPQIWGLGAFGRIGVERMLQMLNDELRRAMIFAGTTSVRTIGRDDLYAVAAGPFADILPLR